MHRAKRVRVRSYNLKGELVEVDADGLYARAIQHEIDHLDGKLFIDYLSVLKRATVSKQIRQFEKDFAESQSIGALASTETLQSQVNLIRTASVVPAPVLPPRLPAGVERPSGSRETTA